MRSGWVVETRVSQLTELYKTLASSSKSHIAPSPTAFTSTAEEHYRADLHSFFASC